MHIYDYSKKLSFYQAKYRVVISSLILLARGKEKLVQLPCEQFL